jgi:predicted DNA-binding protein with PD1-like motif
VKSRLLHEYDGQRTFVLVFEANDEVIGPLTRFASVERLTASRFTAIGAFQEAVVAFFDWQSKTYRHIAIDEQVEVLSLAGDIALKGEEPQVHAHVVLGKPDASAHGGHLIEARVRPTLEVVLVELPPHLRRQMDPQTGLALLRLD